MVLSRLPFAALSAAFFIDLPGDAMRSLPPFAFKAPVIIQLAQNKSPQPGDSGRVIQADPYGGRV